MTEDLNRELIYKEYLMRENYVFHAPYNPEMEFYELVMSGNKKKVEELLIEDFCDKKGLGILSENAVNNFRYHFVITAAMLSRYCIEGGMEHEKAYNLSDLYISRVDKCRNLKEISELHKKMVREYVRRMSDIKTKKVYSKHVITSINYIYDHLHERITLENVARESNISEAYLSRLFKEEMGMSVSEYISRKKIETARNMIEYSDYSFAEISNILAFPSQSYFVKVFKKYEGVTPGKYQSDHLPSAII
ncbi:MAG: helix-turn-helix transcriptional regulator [Lachnospiraceae bacterium]|nr:helix-turn-helix transcriptional regulator [Lachnospiraceae bacterium]